MGPSGGVVEAEELLEKALEKKLIPKGAFFVNVDEKRPLGKFTITTSFPKGSKGDDNSKEMLSDALEKLGFSDVEINEGTQNIYKRYFDANLDRFIVNFDPDTMKGTMESFAKQTLRSTDLSLEDDYYY